VNPLWDLPEALTVGGVSYPIYWEFRQVLRVISKLRQEELPLFIRWRAAMAIFYKDPVAPGHRLEAMQVMASFINGGQTPNAGAPLLDWDKDAPLIIADVNRVAGRELRQKTPVHWWSFLSWFHAIGPGQLSTVVSIRDALRRGQKLSPQQQDFYRQNRALVDRKTPLSFQEQAEKQRLSDMLGR